LRFSEFSRIIFRKTKGNNFAIGNSSIIVFRNSFPGNPTRQYRNGSSLEAWGGAKFSMNDDLFISWSCQNILQPIPSDLAVMFRKEFLSHTPWLNWMYAKFRWRARNRLSIVTFNGPNSKLEMIAHLPDGQEIVDHHGRRGKWTDKEMSGLKSRIREALT
jgi:hypothetical protein